MKSKPTTDVWVHAITKCYCGHNFGNHKTRALRKELFCIQCQAVCLTPPEKVMNLATMKVEAL